MGTLSIEGIFHTVPLVNDEQGILHTGRVGQPVSSGMRPRFSLDSLSVSPSDILCLQSDGIVQNLLENGVVDDALYSSDVNEVACTTNDCNKRISNAGQEWSTGRPGNRPIGAREAAHNSETCLGPYATCDCVQPHTGHNTCDPRQASSQLP